VQADLATAQIAYDMYDSGITWELQFDEGLYMAMSGPKGVFFFSLKWKLKLGLRCQENASEVAFSKKFLGATRHF
jgi:hypothetical protein